MAGQVSNHLLGMIHDRQPRTQPDRLDDFSSTALHCEDEADAQVSADFLDGKATWSLAKYTSVDILAKLYDTRFTDIVQCEEEACEAQRSIFDINEGAAEHEESYGHRFVFDLDGNTQSGRFYTLLESRSAVLKQTIFQEWHDERLFPWVHYVPISLEMEELPEVMRFLALTEEGDRISQKMAMASAEWRNMALRADDELVYLYRLMLEYVRILRDDRDDVKCLRG